MPYDNTDKGVLFRVKDKQSDRHPDYNGSINIQGTEYWLSGWLNTSKKGEKYLSLALGGIKEQNQPDSTTTSDAGNFDDKDDIPF